MDCEIPAVVLEKSVRGESTAHYRLLSPEFGLVAACRRVSLKKASPLPDFFDEAVFAAEKAKMSDMFFVRDFEISKRRTAIGADYDAFLHACEISKCVLRNSRYLESFGALFSAVSSAFDALAAGGDGACARLKFLYLFARSEGYPARESFFRSLGAGDAEAFSKIIATPLSEIGAGASAAPALLEKMERWLRAETDIV